MPSKSESPVFVLRNTTPEGTTDAYNLAVMDTRSKKVIGVMTANLQYEHPEIVEVEAHSHAITWTIEALDEFIKLYNRTVREELYILGLEWGMAKGATKVNSQGLDFNDQKLFFAGVDRGWFSIDGDIKVLPMDSKIPFEAKKKP